MTISNGTPSIVLGALAILLSGATPTAVAAQRPGTPAETRLLMSRLDLETELARLDSLAVDEDLPGYEREGALRRGDDVRARLELGDFRPGDPVSIRITNGPPDIPDPINVEPGPTILLPVLGRVDLSGVLRSELQGYLQGLVEEYYNDPLVQASSLLEVFIGGAVPSAGFYPVSADQPLSAAIMTAGGFGAEATFEDARIERSGETVWEGEELEQAIVRGETLDQMHLQARDQIIIVAQGQGGFWRIAQYLIPVGTGLLTAILLGGR